MKYTVLTVTKMFQDKLLYRIQRISDLEIGGWIEKEENLSHEGNCWIESEAIVCENAVISEDAIITDRALISGNATISGNANVSGRSRVIGDSSVSENAEIKDSASIEENAIIDGNAIISGKSRVTKTSRVSSPDEIIHEQMPNYSITVTKNYVTIGCMTKTRTEWDSVTEAQGIELGFSPEERLRYREILENSYVTILERE